MLKLIQGHSKLVIIYLITVILTGSLLTYLGINSIKNYRELTEKRALEEQNSLINDYTDIFCHIIDSLNDQFSTSPRPDSIAIKAVEENTGRLAKDYFITDQNGKLTEPLFTTPDYANFTASNSTFTARFKRGETAEFAGNDPGKAFSIYESCLENAGSGIDSARAYNAMARVCLKLDDEDQALKYYLTIITEHGKAVNEYGIPYPYFAMHQLINVGDTIPESLIHQFLGALLHNEIPFTAQTEDLVNGIRVNAGRTSSGGSGKIIDSLCNEALRRYDLIISYHEKLARRSFNHWQIDQTRDTLKYLTGANADHIMLIYQFDKGYLGFIVTLKALIPLVIKELNLSSFIFEYNIELINAPDALNESNGILSSYKELPASGGLKYIKISVMDPQKVDKYIFKREMLTGTGLLLMVIVIVLGFYLLLEDIRRKRKMDLMRADFVANVTHELKTPLTSIHMFADSILLGRSKSIEKHERYAHIILKESEKLKRMVNNILEFSRNEDEGLTYTLAETDLEAVLYEIIDEMSYWLEINKFTVRTKINPGIRAMIDSEGLKQVLSNLISNAIKYSDEKKSLFISLYEKEDKAVIEVEDSGIGIPEEQQDLIFTKFYRVFGSDTNKVSGTGLGLTVSKNIVNAMGGDLRVESTPGKGSTFYVILNKL